MGGDGGGLQAFRKQREVAFINCLLDARHFLERCVETSHRSAGRPQYFVLREDSGSEWLQEGHSLAQVRLEGGSERLQILGRRWPAPHLGGQLVRQGSVLTCLKWCRGEYPSSSFKK